MKKVALVLFVILSTAIYTLASADTSSSTFRHYMREIMKDYRNVFLTVQEKRYDLTEIHLNRIGDNIAKVPAVMPVTKMDGSKLDKVKFEGGLNEISKVIEKFRTAYRKEDLKTINDVPREMFNICVDCHKDSKLKKMLTIGMRSTVFSEYMHEIREHYDISSVYAENREAKMATEPLKIIDEYLGRLKNVFPDEGKTGVVMDRRRVIREIDTVIDYNRSVQVSLREDRPADFLSLKNAINGICISCHEPEMIQ